MANSILGSSGYQPDYTPLQEFYDTTFENVNILALAHLKDPLAKWANPSDCGNFPCSAPWNVLYRFQNS